jgi:hypothetical protein
MNPTQIETHPGGGGAPASGEIERAGEIGRNGGIVAASTRERPQFLLCEHCQAPVDRDQRYCVRCGARQSHARNPATSYFAAAARSRRTGGSGQRPEGRALRGPVFAVLLVLLPLAVALGVLVGRGNGGNNDSKLIAALEKQQPAVASTGTGAVASTVAGGASTGNLPSDFSLPRGFVVKLSTLPLQGTDQAAAAKAEQEARAKGAGQVGLINPKDFRTTPSQGASNYVIYSGQFKTRPEAQKALAKLKAHFPGAQVIEVAPAASAPAAPVIAHTAYGTVHQVAGARVTPQQVQQDKQVVQTINRTVGKSYVKAQQNLPDVITVTGGGSGGGSSPSQSAAEKLGEH